MIRRPRSSESQFVFGHIFPVSIVTDISLGGNGRNGTQTHDAVVFAISDRSSAMS